MLLEAALLSIFLAPRGVRPRMGSDQPPSRAAVFLLQWEWFRIYFESGLVKILSGEEQWRNLKAMDKYYENGPLPSWIGWYVQQWPHSFHAFSAGLTLFVELIVVWLLFAPRKNSLCRLIAFLIVTPLQIGIILTANYAFLNYLVLFLGMLLLDDSILRGPVPMPRSRKPSIAAAIVLTTIFLTSIFSFFLPSFPTVTLLDPFRVANRYGLFAVMTRNRYEIEFQGTRDGTTWIAYPFRYKPQDVRKAPGLYAPYQPRFEWNLWFASLGSVQEKPVGAEHRGAIAGELTAGAAPLRRESVRRQAAGRRARDGVSVLVHHARRAHSHRRVVAPRATRWLCTGGNARSGWERHVRVAGTRVAIAEPHGKFTLDHHRRPRHSVAGRFRDASRRRTHSPSDRDRGDRADHPARHRQTRRVVRRA
jgi:hypothetical protein